MAEKKYFSYDFCIIMISVKKISYIWKRYFEVNEGERVK